MRKMASLPHDLRYLLSCGVPAKDPKREFKVGDKIRVNLHHGKIEDAVARRHRRHEAASAKPAKFPVPKSTHYKKGAPLEYGLSVVAQTSPERSTLL
jgi:hypothetical protein